ncbi:MAG TPA: hypothetical protein PLS66_13060, partial [Tepiditoga sp.]|nr:hypothetical protein [Tepiditoga sp.]
GLAYPSYDYRGMEYKLINTKGEIINFIITPNEELTNDLDEIAEFFFQYGNKAYINTDLGNSEILNIDSKYQKYTISSENLNGIKESKNYFYYEVNENNMKKIYKKDKDNKFIKEIIIK